MKRTILLFLLPFVVPANAQSHPLFETDLRVRVVNDELLYVVVQIDNNSGKTVTELEGFLTERDGTSTIVSEQKIVHLHSYEHPLKDGQSVVRAVTYPFDKSKDYRYRFHISHLKFRNDARIFVYTPALGLIRIE